MNSSDQDLPVVSCQILSIENHTPEISLSYKRQPTRNKVLEVGDPVTLTVGDPVAWVIQSHMVLFFNFFLNVFNVTPNALKCLLNDI